MTLQWHKQRPGLPFFRHALTALLGVSPVVAEIKHGGQALVVVEYEEWKTRVLKRQRGEEKQE